MVAPIQNPAKCEVLSVIRFLHAKGSFAMREKGGNHLVPCQDYKVDALKLPNQALRVIGESLQTWVAWRCPDGHNTSSDDQFWSMAGFKSSRC
ncbi:hypothetical protein TNCV_2664721 [Trichonephila clavipes]|nr:hypothetical protein TNCV_2664721 [Trichonephila clavipes]